MGSGFVLPSWDRSLGRLESVRASTRPARGVPIWPYHYHYPDEEWLYVWDGAPRLRDAGGQTVLGIGDVVCFAAGHRGAHTVEGAGTVRNFFWRAVIRSVRVCLSGFRQGLGRPGNRDSGLNALRLVRAGSVDYWHGEGSGPVCPASVTREPGGVPGPPTVNARNLRSDYDAGCQWTPLGDALGGEQLDGAILELEPTADFGPYRYDYGRELWLMVLTGTPTLKHQTGEQELSRGDLACLPEGPTGGRSMLNRSGVAAQVLLLWTTGYPTAVCYPDTGEWVLRAARDAGEIRLRPS